MDKKALYEKAEQVINQALDAAKSSVKTVSVKAGEAAHITKLLIQKATLEHRVTRHFARLGNRVYEKATRDGQEQYCGDPDIRKLVEETRELDRELAQVEATLDVERKQRGVRK